MVAVSTKSLCGGSASKKIILLYVDHKKNVLVERAEANDMYALHINVIDHDIYFQSSNYGPLTANQGPLSSPSPAWINAFGGHGHKNQFQETPTTRCSNDKKYFKIKTQLTPGGYEEIVQFDWCKEVFKNKMSTIGIMPLSSLIGWL